MSKIKINDALGFPVELDTDKLISVEVWKNGRLSIQSENEYKLLIYKSFKDAEKEYQKLINSVSEDNQ
jgi:hypothetical protein